MFVRFLFQISVVLLSFYIKAVDLSSLTIIRNVYFMTLKTENSALLSHI